MQLCYQGICCKCKDCCNSGGRADDPLPPESPLHLCSDSFHLQFQQGPECLRKLMKPILYSRPLLLLQDVKPYISLGPLVLKDVQFCLVTTLPGSNVQGRLVACLGCCGGVAARVVNNILRPPPLAFLRHLGCNLGLCQLPSAAIALHEPLNLQRQACVSTSFQAIQRLPSQMWTKRFGCACTQSLHAPPSKQDSAFYGR